MEYVTIGIPEATTLKFTAEEQATIRKMEAISSDVCSLITSSKLGCEACPFFTLGVNGFCYKMSDNQFEHLKKFF